MKKSSVWIIAGIVLLPVIVGIILFVGDRQQEVPGGFGGSVKKIGLVRIEDAIYSSEVYVRQLREMRIDKAIAGVLLRIDSPGGAAAPSQEIYDEVMRYRTIGKPLIVSMGNVAASGAYYIASAASKIFASPATITGSIGVVFQYGQYYKLLDKIGVSFSTIKSGHFKDMGNPYRAMNEDERRCLQGLLDDTHGQFIRDVCRARGFSFDSLRQLADGRIFTGRQARKLGLVDTLGGYEEALAYIQEKTGVSENSKVVEKHDRLNSWREMFMEEIVNTIPLLKTMRRQAGAYFLYGSW